MKEKKAKKGKDKGAAKKLNVKDKEKRYKRKRPAM